MKHNLRMSFRQIAYMAGYISLHITRNGSLVLLSDQFGGQDTIWPIKGVIYSKAQAHLCKEFMKAVKSGLHQEVVIKLPEHTWTETGRYLDYGVEHGLDIVGVYPRRVYPGKC